ncbi:hypothetical protein [Afipia sp. P52-10]|uniref:hypothetical protein n=1 Tax=Afipia sp. P52-10 TaxID=1429916 RepID=UPI0005500A85|nr:hypothetical protein [Afipia sp. P52-10]
MMHLLVGVLLLVSFDHATAHEALEKPFGIEMGQSLSSLSIQRRSKDAHVDLKSVPKPHGSLSKYSVVATEQAGVCEVVGYAPLEDSDKAARKLDVLRAHLIELLGSPIFLPGDRSPESTGIWTWGSMSKGLRRHPVEFVALYRYESGGRGAAMLKFRFSNREKCAPPMPPNGFR